MGKQDSAVRARQVLQIFRQLNPLIYRAIVNAVHHFFCHGLIRIGSMHLTEAVCYKIAGADMNVFAVIEDFFNRFLQKRHDVHPENMQPF